MRTGSRGRPAGEARGQGVAYGVGADVAFEPGGDGGGEAADGALGEEKAGLALGEAIGQGLDVDTGLCGQRLDVQGEAPRGEGELPVLDEVVADDV